MNRERHRFWESYIRDLQSRMLLADWDLALCWEPAGEDNLAGVTFRGPAHDARIFLCDDFDDYSRTEQREGIVHELVHMHLHPLQSHLLAQLGGSKEWGAILTSHHSHEEYAVDDLARLISPTMPLPKKVKP